MFSTDPKLVSAYEKQFHEHLSLCRPALFVHRDTKDAYPCYRDFFTRQGETAQLINSLSLCSMPRALLERYVRETRTRCGAAPSGCIWTTFPISRAS